jgi:hypothetical protein
VLLRAQLLLLLLLWLAWPDGALVLLPLLIQPPEDALLTRIHVCAHRCSSKQQTTP